MLTFRLPLPPRTNAYWRSIVVGGSVRVLLSKEARAYKESVAGLWLVQTPRLAKLLGPLSVTMHFYRERRAGDVDGRIKPLLDVLQGLAYENDAQIVELHAYNGWRKEDPHVAVEIVSVL